MPISATFSPLIPPLSFPHLCSHVPHRTPSLHSSMAATILRHLTLGQHRSNRLFSIASAAVRQDTSAWTQTPLLTVEPAAESLFHVTIDVSNSPDLAASYSRSGQYLQLRIPNVDKPSFLAIASPPSLAKAKGVFEFLVKSVAGSTAEILCGLNKGDVVELSQVMGKGFDVDQISPPEYYRTVMIFAAGSGISPIRSLIESGLSADMRSDVRLYYGARNLNRMAYQDRFKNWESSGVKIVPVLSQPDANWTGERGYVQVAFARATKAFIPHSTGAVLCGQKQMAECPRPGTVGLGFETWEQPLHERLEGRPADMHLSQTLRLSGSLVHWEVTSILVADGVLKEKILKNF